MKIAFLHSLKSLCHKFQRDESGIALIYITAALPVIIGFSLLAIDVGRLSTLQSTLQHGTDALALAGAGELDRRPDAITRATNAINNLVTTNKRLFDTSVLTVKGSDVSSLCFLKALPNNAGGDALPIGVGTAYPCLPTDNANVAASSEKARYVQVVVQPNAANFNTIFPVNFSGAGIASAGATAVAGMDAAVCKFTPLFMCNPFEASSNTDVTDTSTLVDALLTRAKRRRQIQLLSSASTGNAQTCGPGNFGLIQTDAVKTLPEIKVALAASDPGMCFIQNNLQTKTGDPANAQPVQDAINTRFDLFGTGNSFPSKTDSRWPPASNVRKGYTYTGNNACSASPASSSAQAMALPHDSVFNNHLGNGDWKASSSTAQFSAYWTENFQGTSVATAPNDGDVGAGQTYSNTNLPTRYDIYLDEITRGLVSNKSTGGKEVGTPGCYSAAGVTPDPNRRIIYAAIVNCTAYNKLLTNACNGKSDLQAAAFGKFFITEPITKINDINGKPVDYMYTEFVGFVQPGTDNAVAKDRVQLYR